MVQHLYGIEDACAGFGVLLHEQQLKCSRRTTLTTFFGYLPLTRIKTDIPSYSTSTLICIYSVYVHVVPVAHRNGDGQDIKHGGPFYFHPKILGLFDITDEKRKAQAGRIHRQRSSMTLPTKECSQRHPSGGLRETGIRGTEVHATFDNLQFSQGTSCPANRQIEDHIHALPTRILLSSANLRGCLTSSQTG